MCNIAETADKAFCEMSDIELMSKFFNDTMPPEATQVITDRWDRIAFWPEGQFLTLLGHPARQVYFVASGVVEVTSNNGWSYYVGAGSVMAVGAALAGSTYQYSARARTDSHIIAISGELIKLLARKSEGVQNVLLQDLQQRTAEREDYYVQIGKASKARQVILWMENIARAVQPQIVADSYARFPFEITWMTSKVMLADHLGMATQKVREGLRLLQNAGAIDGPWAGITDRQLQLVLRPGCVEKIEQILSTDAYC